MIISVKARRVIVQCYVGAGAAITPHALALHPQFRIMQEKLLP